MLDAIQVQLTPTVPDQIVIAPSELVGDNFANADCKATITVSAVDDTLEEGDHYTSIIHSIKNLTTGEPIMLSDGNPLYASSTVLVTIYDDDMPGVIVRETDSVTATAELDSNAMGAVGDSSYEDEYTIRLTKQPISTVEINVESTEVASDADTEEHKQVHVNGQESVVITFTPENWNQPQTVKVTAIDDNYVEGYDWLNFASKPSNLGEIQGPLIIDGGYSLYLPMANPLMPPHESNPIHFVVPQGAEFDLSSESVFEANQVDTIILDHQNANWVPSEVTIIPSHVLGAGILNNLVYIGHGPLNGIIHDGLEVLTFNFGKEENLLFVNDTTEAVHIVNLDSTNETSDDYVAVHALSGPMLINGGRGLDTVNVSSADERKVDGIRALLMFDGGDDNDTDVLFVDASDNDVFNLTRLLLEMNSMEVPNEISEGINPILPRESYLLTLRDSTGGSFSLTLNDPVTSMLQNTTDIPYPPTTSQIEYAIDITLLPDQKSCGSSSDSNCASTVKAWQLGNTDTYFISFLGERLNSGVTMSLNGDGLENYYEEIFLNTTNDPVKKNSDIAYTNVDDLFINMGFEDKDIVGNIRGSLANHTYIVTQGGDDKIFMSSDANENHDTALEVEVLYGLLDYIRGELHIELNTGRHRLFMSDCFSEISKGVGTNGFVEITNSSITNLGKPCFKDLAP